MLIAEVIIDLINNTANNDSIQARSDEPPLLDYCQGASSVSVLKCWEPLLSLAYPTDLDFNCFLPETMGEMVS